MVKFRTGPVSDHIKESQGADANINRFYHSRYESDYGIENYRPRKGRAVGTGYSANFRPGVYYKRSLDQVDNPLMGFLLTDNYESMTKQHFLPAKGSNGKDALPLGVIQKSESGFIRQRPLTVPTVAEAKSVFFDSRRYGGLSRPGLEPRHKALLHTLKQKDPVEEENASQGPAYMKSETAVKFLGEPTAPLKTHQKDIGFHEETGFTHNKNIEPITYKPDDAHTNESPGTVTSRPTGRSETESNFNLWKDASGKEPLPGITARSNCATGFIREAPRKLYATRVPAEAFTALGNVPPLVAARIKKKDPAEYMNLIHKDSFRTVTSASFQGRQRGDRTEEKLLNREHIGEFELSGDCKNNDIYNETKDTDPERYLTNYNLRHYDMNPKGIDREGFDILRGTQTAREDGFSRDFGVHSLGGRMNDMTLRLQRLEPYTARSIKRRDRYIVDHTHKHKVTNDHEGIPAIEPLSTATLQVHG